MNEEILKRIEALEARVSNLEKSSVDVQAPSTSPKRAQVSVVEFLKGKKPSTSVDKTLVFAVYHENTSGTDIFNAEDISSLWRQAKEAPPANINDLINKNIKKGYIAEEKTGKGQKKAWYVTMSGAEAVNNAFQGKQDA